MSAGVFSRKRRRCVGGISICVCLVFTDCGKRKNRLRSWRAPRLHDNRALALVTLLAPLTLFTAPIAVFILLKNRKNPSSFAPARESPLVDCHDPRDFVDRSLDGSAGGLEFLDS